jgi:arylsulfatase A-like enzyme
MNAIVLTFDRLPVGFLSCFGNSWIATPNFDRLASQSALFEQHFADSPTIDAQCAAWWSGHFGWRPHDQSNGFSLPKFLGDHNITFRLLAESDGSPAPTQGNRFPTDHAEFVHGDDGLDVEPDATPVFRLIARAQRDLRLLRTSRREPWLLWIKSRGIPIPWLPPRSFAAQFLDLEDDEEDEEPQFDEPDGDETPDDDGAVVEMSDEQFDDLLRSVAQLPEKRDSRTNADRTLMRKVCGGYVALLDAALGRLVEQIDHEAASSPTMLIVAAGQGLTVREPGRLTNDWELAAEETVHTPLFIRLPSASRGTRRQELVQTVDLVPTLAEWFGVDRSALALDGRSLLPLLNGEQVEPRPSATMTAGPQLSGIRTSDFYLVSRQENGAHEVERRLFAKPEDIWEVNDVAAQTPEIVEQLARDLAESLGDEKPADAEHTA